MRVLIFLLIVSFSKNTYAQQTSAHPCATDTMYRQFDFWLGEWEVFGLKGQRAGSSKIEQLLDSCVILENWTSAQQGYTGKSFNTYNAATKQWQQTWVDNAGGTTEYLRGHAEKNAMIFYADDVRGPKGAKFLRRLSFYKVNENIVRQHGERSDDNGITWTTEYDLTYKRKQ